MKDKPLRVLIVEDSEDDTLLLIRHLMKGGYKPVYERVETAGAMKKALQEKQWDIILCDYKMPHFSGSSALTLLKEIKKDIPIIVVSGTIDEETALECMRLGAHDYFMKGKISRLCMAIKRELAEAKTRQKHKHAEELLFQNEEKYRSILESMEEGYYEVDLTGNFTFFNDSMSRILGYPAEELMGMNNRALTDKENAKKLFQAFNKVYNTGKPTKEFDWEIIGKDGAKRYIEASVSLLRDSSGKAKGFRGIVRDITERMKVLEELQRSEEKYRTILEDIREGYYEVDLSGNFTFFNDTVCRVMGYSRDELMGMNNRQYTDKEELKKIFDAYNRVYATGEPNKEVTWQITGKDGAKRHIEGFISLLKDPSGNPKGFRGIAHDITERKLAEAKLQQTLESLKKAVGTTISVLISALESRDPYTAGHQSNSASLACAIAAEMGLCHDKIEGILMAGCIHDIGKLAIPAEILTKPTKLTNLEYSLIKEHPQCGFEMLKDVESPWPLAQIVYQHHERLNGSGYPRNLKGDEIIMEARIMAVADVVEAMGSHRPYRAALGIEAALEEIEKNRGTLYDADVVNACVKLFREKSYRLTL
jgi:PAS domain S-box-containing protein